ncbi:MAG: leucine-rich repeat protein, partial [Alistipes sp.]|nr:leucine-rich repeat protein [Alistipes sp.]
GLFGGMPTLVNVTIGDQVKTLHKWMFAGSSITELTIPGTVNTIANDVFYGCTELATLTFNPSPTGESLTIGYDTDGEAENLFQDNNKLTTLNLNRELIYTFGDSNIDTSSEGLFGGMPTLVNVTIGDQVKTLQKYMFAGTGITTFEIPTTVTSIAQNVFDDCSALSSITFAESATPLQIKGQGDSYGPFYDSPLATIVFNRPIDYRKLNDSEFNPDADYLGLFAINPSLKSQITEGTNLTIGQYITNITNHMFCYLPIKTLAIPGTVNTIGNDVFNGCDQLVSLTFEASPTETALTIGYEATDGEDENLFQEWCPLTTLNLNRELIYTFEEEAETIDSYSEGLFGSLETLTNVTLGDQVKTLQKYMFAGTGITELVIPVTVTSIAQNVFDDCSALSSITFVESATPLQIKGQGDSYGPFYDSPLAKIVFKRPIDYKKLNGDEFNPTSDALGLFAISSTARGKVPAEAETNLTIGQNITNITNYMFCNLPVKTLTIPEAVNTIGEGAFKGSGITNIRIPANVTSIGDDAFKNCIQLVEVAFEDSATPITMGYQPGVGDGWGNGPFYQSPLENIELMREVDLTTSYDYVFEKQNNADAGLFAYEDRENLSATATLQIGDNVKTILPYMFSELPITEVTIPSSVTKIENDAFYGCAMLANITFTAGTEPLTIGYDTAGDDEGLFATSQNLATVNLGRELNYTFPLGDLDDATEGIFGNHPSLTSVTLGENVKTVLPFMFANTGITRLNILGNVTEIKDYAFYNCTALEELRFEYSATPLTLGFQDWTDELGPFYQSPLKYIELNRDIVYNDNYANSCDGWDEGAFSNQYYEIGDWTANVIIGEQVTTLPRYMFATMRMQQLHIHESVENIGTGLVEKCKVLNAIVLYDTK